ncbi:MAG: Proteasome subunit [Blastocatellia bacterium]|jgi:hypothetical protein|nr:Proteasome subunit [Blastocatellia bacterium]
MKKDDFNYSLYKSDLVKLGCHKKRRTSRPFAELEADMTLCMAAKASDYDYNCDLIVLAADKRAEASWAGGDVSTKWGAGHQYWPALFAGEISKAEDFLATSKATLAGDEITALNIFDKFTHVSNVHKEKLCQRYVRQELGISFERLLTQGENELPPEVRARIFHELGRLEFGCDIIICGFTDEDEPHIIEIDTNGEVYSHQNFAAIGTGAVIAKSTMYHRGQTRFKTLEATLYTLYEASRMAYGTAPGVGEIKHFNVIERKDNGGIEITRTNEKCMKVLEAKFDELGPKPLGWIPAMDASCFYERRPATPLPESAVAQPSDSETSEGQS